MEERRQRLSDRRQSADRRHAAGNPGMDRRSPDRRHNADRRASLPGPVWHEE